MKIDNINWLHVELSSKCNAWCPACPRNKNGFGLADRLVEEDLDLGVFENALKMLTDVHTVQLCGNYGDPVASSNINDAIDIAKKYVNKIQIHTNGSLRSVNWWKNLAKQLSDISHDVWFGIDGLSGVHEIYRQGTDYNKVIENACSFIENGGNATWQFIPYAHNEHQVKDCIRLSQQLGFKKFKLVKSHRSISIAKHYRTGIEYELKPVAEIRKIIRMPTINTTVNIENCMHLKSPSSVYLAATGKLSYCCYMSDFKTFDNLEDLFYNPVNLNNNICLDNCGS